MNEVAERLKAEDAKSNESKVQGGNKPEVLAERLKASQLNRPILGVVIGILLCGVSFYTGVEYQKHHASLTPVTATSASSVGTYGERGGTGRYNGAIGTVTAVSSTSVTIQDEMRGTSKAYTITSSTTVTNGAASAALADIKIGERVMVTASTSDMAVAAKIVINPTMPSGRGGAADDTPATPTDTSNI
jgi:hypothetical protein